MVTWVGKFKSTSYWFIHGELKVDLKPLSQMDYVTNVYIRFNGLAAIVSSIASVVSSLFRETMVLEVKVCNGNRFETRVGGADVVFYIDEKMPLSPDLKKINGHYTSHSSSHGYRSEGVFFLER